MRQAIFAPRYTIADAFCGCGGLSLGFTMTRRFDVLLGTDIKPEALATFSENHLHADGSRPATIEEDIAKTSSADVAEIIQRHGPQELDCLIGGPPCEGFSQNRTDRDSGSRTHKFIDDPRNQLFRWFVDLAAKLQPKVVLIENVPDLVRHRDGETRNEVLTALDEAGYVTTARILNAADYGVPQMRRRAFFLAQRKSDLAKYGLRIAFPTPTHQPYPMMHDSLAEIPNWLTGDSGYWVNVREAIGDLPVPAINDGECVPAVYTDSQVTAFRAQMRATGDCVANHTARKLGKNGLQKLTLLQPGQRAVDLPEEFRPKGSYHYSYTRMRWAEPARTITKFVYHVGSGQFGHPEEDRAITIREAARLQSFPDDFRFVGTNEIRKFSSLVGSAVPPLLAKALARQIALYLDQLHLAQMAPDDRLAAKRMTGDAVLRRLETESWSSEEQDSVADELVAERAGQLPLFMAR